MGLMYLLRKYMGIGTLHTDKIMFFIEMGTSCVLGVAFPPFVSSLDNLLIQLEQKA